MTKNKLHLLYTEIGRGHPFYLDGIIESLNRNGGISIVRTTSSVFEESSGLSYQLWKLVRYLYKAGAQNNAVGKLYGYLRNETDYNQPSHLINLLGAKIKNKYLSDSDPLIVAHPLLVAMLKEKSNLYYQHGELIAPEESVVKGAEFVFVPTEEVAEKFYKFYSKDQIIVTSLCIEPSIVQIAKDCFLERMIRYEKSDYLCGGYFSSGAEPEEHVDKLIGSLLSTVQAGHKAIAFVRHDGNFFKNITKKLTEQSIICHNFTVSDPVPINLPSVSLVIFKNRREENILATRFFRFLDFFVSPSHERTNWAAGLGLPIFVTDPPIGPFSPLNRKFILDNNIGNVIVDKLETESFSEKLILFKQSGQLAAYAENGFGKYEINGFKNIVEFVKNNIE